MKIRRLLIANRGEIALRIMRTCEKLGIETVLAASETDLDSVPARRANRVVCIGKAAPAQSYLNAPAIVAAAVGGGADAIHPGYGFLSENAVLARACHDAGVAFIGATPEQLESVGDKWRAREIAEACGLPVVPGGMVKTPDEARALVRAIGTPALVKAMGGGGGRGMRLIEDLAEARDVSALAMAEAEAAFGDSRIYIERFVSRGRHIEVQLLGDGVSILHLGDRDCSIQRRYQKLIEEAPAANISEALRSRLHAAALGYGRKLAYRGLGTVEFLVDATSGEFYFLEMNARVQVEHPITEAVTGLDLVEEQILVAESGVCRLVQSDVHFSGCAVEFRINAEDPTEDFRPSPGRIMVCKFPAGPGVRVDSHIEAGETIPPFYDSLLAKIVVHGSTRQATLERAGIALDNCRIEGIATNIGMHRAVLGERDFMAGAIHTNWLSDFWKKAHSNEPAHPLPQVPGPYGRWAKLP